MKKGFGLIEVLFASVVLAFLVIGLNMLQKGNRESILRVRARDAANTIAQDVIDSISVLGSASKVSQRKCTRNNNNEPNNDKDLCKYREFEGMAGKIKVDYDIDVEVVKAPDGQMAAYDETGLTRAQTTGADKLIVEHEFARQVNVTVSWNFKGTSQQSISVSSVIR